MWNEECKIRLMLKSKNIALLGVLPALIIAIMVAAQPVNDAQTEQILNHIVETVEFQDAPIEDILRLLARQNELNLIIGPDSMGIVSLRFSGVTLRAALDVILRAKGFSYQIYDNILLVSRPDSLERSRGTGLETRIFQLKYCSAGEIKTALDTLRALSAYGYANAFVRGEGKSTDIRSDVLIVKDQPSNLKHIAGLIAQLDQPVRQVTIDVQFVETILGEDQKTGIDWQQFLRAKGSYQGRADWSIGRATEQTSGGVLEFGSLSSTSFNVVLEMLLSNRRSKLLSQPRLTTLDNQKATISVGTLVWIEKRTGTGGGTEMQISYEERNVPIELIVVPHILHNDKILLELQPKVEEITGWQQGSAGYRLPTISTRSADSRIEVRDGETAIIGGLIKNSTMLNENRVWLLGSIPLIGHLFRYKTQTVERTELTIFITPRIIRDEQLKPESIPDPTPPLKIPAGPELTVQTAPDSTAPKVEPLDLRAYFPLRLNDKWTYRWSDGAGNNWESVMFILSAVGTYCTAEESIPEGKYKSKSKTVYRWTDDGLLLMNKVNVGRDSTVYDSGRVIIPAKMAPGQTIENHAVWSQWKGGQPLAKGEIVQVQTLLPKQNVTTSAGKYKNCAVVETIWYDAADKTGIKRRKVVWYAKDVGPVKVESDIPLEEKALKGRISGVLTKR